VSGVIVGAQKAGKSALLNHLVNLGAGRTESLFCRVDIDDVESLGFTDDAFLRLFLEDLKRALEENLQTLETEAHFWDGEQEAPAADPALRPAPAIRTTLSQELAGSRQMDKVITELLDRSGPIEPADTHRIFSALPRIRKRIVLVIDEFHRSVQNEKFTNKLWAFLRGASTQGKILTIVSSPVHLMDSSLHGPAAEKHYDRLNLFNHYQTQFLEPFNPSEARGFVEWLGPVDPPLTDEEAGYICDLGGGSPHFLKRARELFLRQRRPDTPEKRAEFERMVALQELDSDFSLLWGRCSADERRVLEEVAKSGESADPLADKLEREGYVTKGSGGNRLFSTLFQKFVQRQSKEPVKKPIFNWPHSGPAIPKGAIKRLRLQPMSGGFATAMALALPETPVFEVEIQNTMDTEVEVQIGCHVVNYSDHTVRRIPIPTGSNWAPGHTVLKRPELLKLRDAVPANVNWTIHCGPPGKLQEIDRGQFEIKLLPPNHFPMAVWDDAEQSLLNQTWLIAAWVRPGAPGLQQLLNKASEECELVGYQAPEGEDPAEYTRRQVAAIYNAVKGAKLNYQNSAQVYLHDPKYYIQQVRLPEQTLKDRAANCLDMAVLFASLMASCQIDPLILFVPGHAVVGWSDGAGGREFLQTTGIAQRSFEEAWQEGCDLFKERETACVESCEKVPKQIDHPEDFGILVDVMKVSTSRGLMRI